MFIRSERLFLRPVWPEDVEEIVAVLGAAAAMSNVPAERLPTDIAHACAMIAAPRDPLLPTFCITLPSASGTTLIGAIGLGRNGDEVTLGYWIAAVHWGNGYAAEAARAVLRLACAIGHRRITARHEAGNAGALRVLTVAGFVQVAQGSDSVAYQARLDCARADDTDPNGTDAPQARAA